jgi:dihydroflavonol-4-reductase
VLKAAKAAGVERIVVTSSCAAVASARHDKEDFDESDWSATDNPRIRPYDLSKTLAERAAWDFVKQNPGMELTVVNPSQVFGPPLDRHVETSGDILLSQLNGAYPLLARFGLPVVDVRDVASAHVAAMASPKAAGERFIIANEFLWVMDMARILKRAFPQYARRLPRGVSPDWLARLSRPFVPALKTIGDDLGRTWRVSHAKAERVLGIRPRPAEEAIVAMGEALIRFGLVKPL